MDGEHSLATSTLPRRKLLEAFAAFNAAAAVMVVAGLLFSKCGSATLFAAPAAVAAASALIVHRHREFLTRFTWLLVCLALVRIWGTVFVPGPTTIATLSALMLLLVIVVIASIHVCLSPLNIGALQPLARLLRLSGSVPPPGDTPLWYYHRIAFRALCVLFMFPVPVVLVSWIVQGRNHEPWSMFGMDATTAIAFGFVLPIAIITLSIFLLPLKPPDTRNLVFNGLGLTRITFWSILAVWYLYGLWLEERTVAMYGLWSVCFVVLLLTFLSVGRLSVVLSERSQVLPVQDTSDISGTTRPLKEIMFIYVLLSAFTFFQIFLLAVLFK
jgi:hypothetical protein